MHVYDLDCTSFTSFTIILPTQDSGSVPLEIAAWNGRSETVERLLKEEVNINHQNNVRSARQVCIRAQNVSTVMRTFFFPFPFHYVQFGQTTLYLVSQKGHVKIVKLLLQKCADINICDEVHACICTYVHNIYPATI